MSGPETIQPALACAADGAPRRVGVEIEFGGLDCYPAALLVAQQFGGDVKMLDNFRFEVETPGLGAFRIELDLELVHANDPDSTESIDPESLGAFLEAGMREAIGELSRWYAPVEVVCPPLPLARLDEVDALVERLRGAGARGTRDSVVYAFGVHLNFELPALDAATILNYLRAYLVSADWLRQDIGIDLTRRALPFIDPFPRDYLRHVLPADYAPDLARLIDDYMLFNPTRNRDLDMLPLFLWLSPQQVRATIDDPRVKARPTLHYRLPDCRIDDVAWNVSVEWNRWARTVEALAAEPERLRAACDACLARVEGDRLLAWVEDFVDWLLP